MPFCARIPFRACRGNLPMGALFNFRSDLVTNVTGGKQRAWSGLWYSRVV